MVKLNFQNDRHVEEEDLSLTLLDIALKHGVPHLRACGGLGRCSTCRVKILEHPENVLPRSSREQSFAERHGLDDTVRQACQTRVKGPVSIQRLVVDDVSGAPAGAAEEPSPIREIKLAVLFCDIRNFTSFTERHLAYDVFHMLNRHFFHMGEAVLRNNGYLHQYYGDGLMAVFGLYGRASGPICLDAVSAGMQMLDRLKIVNTYLQRNFSEEFRIGIGVHFGDVLAGKLGHPRNQHLAVLGDVVNVASRVEDASKTSATPLVISDVVYRELGPTVLNVVPFTAELKGKTGQQKLYAVNGFASGFDEAGWRLRY